MLISYQKRGHVRLIYILDSQLAYFYFSVLALWNNFISGLLEKQKGLSIAICLCIPTSHSDSSVGKESTCNAGHPGSIPRLETSAREGIGYPLQYSGLENSMDCIVHGVAKNWALLSGFHFHVTAHQIGFFFPLRTWDLASSQFSKALGTVFWPLQLLHEHW